MIALKSMGHVAILQGSIGYACGPVLMIPERVVFCFYRQAPHPVAWFQLWM
jgi:hypothetical protein